MIKKIKNIKEIEIIGKNCENWKSKTKQQKLE